MTYLPPIERGRKSIGPALLGEESAIDDDFGAGHVPRFIRDEEQNSNTRPSSGIAWIPSLSASCTSTAACTASTTLRNSASTLSPIVLAISTRHSRLEEAQTGVAVQRLLLRTQIC